MGIFSSIADTFSAMWKVDNDATNEDELVMYKNENPEIKRIFIEADDAVEKKEKGLGEGASKKKGTKKKYPITPRAQVDIAKNKPTSEQPTNEQKEMGE